MADISKLTYISDGAVRTEDLSQNTLVADNLKIKLGGSSHVTLSGSLTSSRTISLPDANVDLSNIANLYSLSGVSVSNTDLGVFTGTTIPDSSSIKSAIQSLETAHESFVSTVSSTYLPLSGGTMSGPLNMGSQSITNLAAPSDAQDAATKGYIDSLIDLYLPKTGGTMSGDIDMNQLYQLHKASRLHVSTAVTTYTEILPDCIYSEDGSGGYYQIDYSGVQINDASFSSNLQTAALMFSGDGTIESSTGVLILNAPTANIKSNQELDMSTNKIINISDPDDDQDAATKKYVDDAIDAIVSAEYIKKTLIAGESFSAGTSFLVRWGVNGETAGRVYKADKDAAIDDKFYIIGIALSVGGASDGENIDVLMLGTHVLGASDTPLSSADIGKPVFLNSLGSFSLIAPSAVDEVIARIGVVKTTDSIWVQPAIVGVI